MVQEELVSDLEVIDFLELFNSTVECGKVLGISQSSCSRRYRAFSNRFGLGFDRIADQYQATQNHDVLHSLRQAAQKLRARSGRARFCLGWQLGGIKLDGFSSLGVHLEARPLNSWKLLSLLEQRLIDVAVMGLMEFQSLLSDPLPRLRARRLPLSPTMLCVPVCQWDLRVLAHVRHPLQGRREITADDLSQYPSPALPLGMAPILMGSLQNHGLANKHCGLLDYEEDTWEGCAADGISLSYGAPHRLADLDARYEIQPLNYDPGMRECIGVVGHRDVLSDPGFPAFFKRLLAQTHAAVGMNGSNVHWLS
jgi:hypothetical protein